MTRRHIAEAGRRLQPFWALAAFAVRCEWPGTGHKIFNRYKEEGVEAL